MKRLPQNKRYLGRWSYGRTKSKWLSKKDYNVRVPQSEESAGREKARSVSTPFPLRRVSARRRRDFTSRFESVRGPCPGHAPGPQGARRRCCGPS
ncbi:MAG: hypothetical protein GXP25_15560 [Planctomycetes bacterium]|nr:hypothetical protein [Planctomycetota bacterium]